MVASAISSGSALVTCQILSLQEPIYVADGVTGYITSPARKREMPLSEMSQLYRHLALPHTLLEIWNCRASAFQTLLPLLPHCSRENRMVVIEL
jgi:hypothetical protein